MTIEHDSSKLMMALSEVLNLPPYYRKIEMVFEVECAPIIRVEYFPNLGDKESKDRFIKVFQEYELRKVPEVVETTNQMTEEVRTYAPAESLQKTYWHRCPQCRKGWKTTVPTKMMSGVCPDCSALMTGK